MADRDEFVEGAIAVQPLMRELPGKTCSTKPSTRVFYYKAPHLNTLINSRLQNQLTVTYLTLSNLIIYLPTVVNSQLSKF